MRYKLFHKFFSNDKALSYNLKNIRIGMFQKEAFFLLLLGYGYMRNSLARLGGYPTHRDVADMPNLFYFHFVFCN